MDFTSVTQQLQQAKAVRGLVATVAKRLNRSHEHVRQVALGARTSAPVAKALVAEQRRRERKQQKLRGVSLG